MPKKRTTPKSKNDKPTNEGSESLFQEEDNAKRAKLDLLSDTTIEDLPIELLECILVKVVAMEVRGWRLAKSDWRAKVDLVTSRLGAVCSHWSSVLSTISFQTKLHRALDATVLGTIRLEVLHEIPINTAIEAVTTLKDEVFMLHRNDRKDYTINIHNHSDMEEVKAVIQLPRTDPVLMTGCSVSNCVYVSIRNRDYSLSILRITKDIDGKFKNSPWLSHVLSISTMSVGPNGNLILFASEHERDVVSIFDASGSLQHEVKLSLENVERYEAPFQKSNGNLVFPYINFQNYEKTILEFDMSGSVVRKYESPYSEESSVNFADIYGRIIITEPFDEMQLLDCEFNLLGTYTLQQDVGKNLFLFDLHYDSERNEIWRIHYDKITRINSLTTFRFIEE